ncbi:MAG: hypothetical protein FWE34_04870 [Defluviitaleaceae bacterium]|nr:hypothetical protein [Defluviitaleaceae bacterium]
MEIAFKNPGLRYMVDSIMMFQKDDVSDYWRDSLFRIYSHMDRAHFDSLDTKKREDYIYEVMKNIYEKELDIITHKLDRYERNWQAYKEQIEDAFSDAFGIDCRKLFNDMTCNISLNPIEPRFLATQTFDVFWLSSERDALGVTLHEIIHFVWFYVWQRHFGDDVSEYETPHLKWVFSEMVIDPIMRADSRISGLNPYFADGCTYSYFYDMTIDGKPILETLLDMYKRLSITDFMEQGYDYCLRNEDAIRSQMK